MLTGAIKEESNVIRVHGCRKFQTDVGSLASKVKDKPVVLTSHSSISSFKRRTCRSGDLANLFYAAITARYSLRAADAIIATTKEAREIAEASVDEKKIVVIPHGVEVSSRAQPRLIGRKEGGYRSNG